MLRWVHERRATVCSVCTSGYLQLTRGGACIYLPGALSSCEDGVRNGNEEGVNCGGPNCVKCAAARLAKVSFVIVGIAGAITAVVVTVVGLYIRRSVGTGFVKRLLCP
jgi:hypothetical protein